MAYLIMGHTSLEHSAVGLTRRITGNRSGNHKERVLLWHDGRCSGVLHGALRSHDAAGLKRRPRYRSQISSCSWPSRYCTYT
ncbi:hypothetical protein BDZ91DRAFT_299675 [Kalaharituber pfeilii]|nr:hypothetical protein BDZ91DRAFT_299675 [Kalaharituber pfeilii]